MFFLHLKRYECYAFHIILNLVSIHPALHYLKIPMQIYIDLVHFLKLLCNIPLYKHIISHEFIPL